MKKLILFIFLFSMNYGCDFVETKNLIEKRAINSVKELELQNKIVCDEEWKKIIYIVNMKEFGNLLVNGFILENNIEDKEKFLKELEDNSFVADNLFNKLGINDLKNNNISMIHYDYTKDKNPDNQIYTIIYFLEDDEPFRTFMLNKKYGEEIDEIIKYLELKNEIYQVY